MMFDAKRAVAIKMQNVENNTIFLNSTKQNNNLTLPKTHLFNPSLTPHSNPIKINHDLPYPNERRQTNLGKSK